MTILFTIAYRNIHCLKAEVALVTTPIKVLNPLYYTPKIKSRPITEKNTFKRPIWILSVTSLGYTYWIFSSTALLQRPCVWTVVSPLGMVNTGSCTTEKKTC